MEVHKQPTPVCKIWGWEETDRQTDRQRGGDIQSLKMQPLLPMVKSDTVHRCSYVHQLLFYTRLTSYGWQTPTAHPISITKQVKGKQPSPWTILSFKLRKLWEITALPAAQLLFKERFNQSSINEPENVNYWDSPFLENWKVVDLLTNKSLAFSTCVQMRVAILLLQQSLLHFWKAKILMLSNKALSFSISVKLKLPYSKTNKYSIQLLNDTSIRWWSKSSRCKTNRWLHGWLSRQSHHENLWCATTPGWPLVQVTIAQASNLLPHGMTQVWPPTRG